MYEVKTLFHLYLLWGYQQVRSVPMHMYHYVRALFFPFSKKLHALYRLCSRLGRKSRSGIKALRAPLGMIYFFVASLLERLLFWHRDALLSFVIGGFLGYLLLFFYATS